jgi:hypothetical protein
LIENTTGRGLGIACNTPRMLVISYFFFKVEIKNILPKTIDISPNISSESL